MRASLEQVLPLEQQQVHLPEALLIQEHRQQRKQLLHARALADAINAGRAEEGLDVLAWDDSLAAIAKKEQKQLQAIYPIMVPRH